MSAPNDRIRPTLRIRSVLTLGLAGLLCLAVPVAAYYAWEVYSARRYTTVTLLPAARTAVYPLALADLTPRQIEILLRIEDPRFFAHGGVDMSTPGAGITTITQALVALLYVDRFTPGGTKVRQALIAAYALDPLMSKDEQLRMFVNVAHLGPGVRGFDHAARVYFERPFRNLTEDQYLGIVAMLVAPGVFDVSKFPARNAERVARIRQVVSGAYQPRGLLDLYYGKLDAETQRELPPLSYFASYYR